MTFKTTLESYYTRFATNGEFSLFPTESINDVVKKEGVSNGYGVYVIFSRDNLERPIYIGRAGTICKNGAWKKQGIRERLTAVQKGMRRVDYCRKLMKVKYRNGLQFRWFITRDGKEERLPALVEAELLQAHLDEFRCLPPLNETA